MDIHEVIILIFVLILAWLVWNSVKNGNQITEGFKVNKEAAENVYSLITKDRVKMNKLNARSSVNLNGPVTVSGNMSTTADITVAGSATGDKKLSYNETRALQQMKNLKTKWDKLKPRLMQKGDKITIFYDPERRTGTDHPKGGNVLGWFRGLPSDTKRYEGITKIKNITQATNPFNTIQIV